MRAAGSGRKERGRLWPLAPESSGDAPRSRPSGWFAMRFRAAGAAVVRIRSSRVAGRFADLIHQRMLFLEDAGKAANRASATESAASACRRSSGTTNSSISS